MNEVQSARTLERQMGLPHPIQTRGHDFVLSIALAARALSAEIRRLLAGSELTEAQLNILLLLKYQFTEGATQVQLSRRILVNRANVTGLIDRLERDGLVARSAVRADRRVKRVALTARGHEVLAKAEPAYFSGIRRMVAAIPESERQSATQTLLALCAELNSETSIA